MTLTMARVRMAGTIPGAASLAIVVFFVSAPAAAGHPCDRFALDGITLGMSPATVAAKMGDGGLSTSIRLPDGTASTGVLYPGAPGDIYLEYDRPIDHRKARVVRVRAPLVLSNNTTQDLIRRFGQPHAGADDLKDLLRDGGPAVWIDQTCGLVMTAFRPTSSWWGAAGGARLQVETFELALRTDSPARSRLTRGANAPAVARPAVPPPVAPAIVMLQDDLTLPEEWVPPPVAPPPSPTPSWPQEAPLIQTARLEERAAPPSALPDVPIAHEERQAPSTGLLVDDQPSAPVEAAESPSVPQEAAESPSVPQEAAESPSAPVEAAESPSAPQEQQLIAFAAQPLAEAAPSVATTRAVSIAHPEPVRAISGWRPAAPHHHHPPAANTVAREVPSASAESAGVPAKSISGWNPGAPHPPSATTVAREAPMAPAESAGVPAKSISGWSPGAPHPPSAATVAREVPMSQAEAEARVPARSIADWRPAAPSDEHARTPDIPAERISYVKPVYPPTAKGLGRGQVTLEILVQPDGSVAKSVSLVHAIPPGRGFEEASIEAVRKWRFTPATRDGRAVPSRLTVTVDIE